MSVTVIEKGNIFDSSCQVITCTTNLVGVMGAGVAKEFKKRYPEYFLKYRVTCATGELGIGKLYLHKEFSPWILSFPTKKDWRNASELSFIELGLDDLVDKWESWGVTSLALPALGCTNGGLEWDIVRDVILSKLEDISLEVELYTPWSYKAVR